MLNRMMIRLFVFILMIGFVSGLDASLHCPDNIYEGEDFKCDVKISDGNGTYDLKIEIDKERSSNLRIWTGEVWQSGYYYLRDFIQDSGIVELNVSKAGEYDVVLKVRQRSVVKKFNAGKLEVQVGEIISEEVEKVEVRDSDVEEIEAGDSEKSSSRVSYVNIDSTAGNKDDIIFLNKDAQIISLNEGEVVENNKWDYISKNGRTVDMLPYWFCLFLIFLAGILMWERKS